MNAHLDHGTSDIGLDYGHRLLVNWVSGIAREMRYPSEEARELLKEVTAGDSFADLRTAEATAPLLRPLSGKGKESWRRFREALGPLQEITGAIPPNLPARRIQELGQILRLGSEDVRILEALLFDLLPGPVEVFLKFLMSVRLRSGPIARRSCPRVLNAGSHDLSRILGLSRVELRRCLDQKSRLVRKGLVEVEGDLDITLPDTLRRLYLDMDEQADVRSLLLRQESAVTDLEWSDFSHLGQDREDLAAVLGGTVAQGRSKGVNVLLYGPPGMGKTSFARVAARHVGLHLLDVGETDEWGWEPTARERLRELRLAQSLLEEDSGSALLLDEMDDVLEEGRMPFPWLPKQEGRSGSSRIWLHRLLENTPVPTVWITNNADTIDRAVLRRMTYALELRLPPARVRAGIWSRQLSRHGFGAGEVEARSLAEEFEASPGVAEGAIRAGQLGGGDIELVHRSVERLSRLMGCGRPGVRGTVDFDPALICADMDPVELAERLVSGGERRFSMCLQGPPGTDKSAYVRYLADQLGMEILSRRASDLMSPFVGETEQQIARAFDMARDAGAFLVFDEADSLLGERRNARYSWEISQVNEMLTWMECHPLPFACTTNFGSSLDVATVRRFLFKITLDFLDRDRSRMTFRKWFELEAPPVLDEVENLTPGDFEVVRRKARVMGLDDDGEKLVALLQAEVEARLGRRAPVGFLGYGRTSP